LPDAAQNTRGPTRATGKRPITCIMSAVCRDARDKIAVCAHERFAHAGGFAMGTQHRIAAVQDRGARWRHPLGSSDAAFGEHIATLNHAALGRSRFFVALTIDPHLSPHGIHAALSCTTRLAPAHARGYPVEAALTLPQSLPAVGACAVLSKHFIKLTGPEEEGPGATCCRLALGFR